MSDVRAARLELWKLFDQGLQSSLASQSPPSVFHVARAIRRYDVLDASKNAVRRWFSHRYAVLFEQYTGLDVRREFFAARSAKEQLDAGGGKGVVSSSLPPLRGCGCLRVRGVDDGGRDDG
ncbi:unnamed protein product [Zymoseptoria tritici ST99CH_3D7]|uniref:Uncharacterized protein n=1 Tax=Zymoseptoria tritici (strain ST99CH_3D7) TaxID=1276538 RepID=A0A1X7S9Y8_ZYMT9|nr:unnamed protein product [Zymoseptoria tritici ST99CH_3D7]